MAARRVGHPDSVLLIDAEVKWRQEGLAGLHVAPLADDPECIARSTIEKTDHRHSLLLRPRRERLSGRRAAEQRDELAPFHCAIPPVRSTERIAHLSYGGRLLRCGSQVESDAQAWAIVRKVIE